MSKPNNGSKESAIRSFLHRNGVFPGMIDAVMKSLGLFARPAAHDHADSAQLGAVLYALRFEPPVESSDADDITQYKKARALAQSQILKAMGEPTGKLASARIYGALNALAVFLAHASQKFGQPSAMSPRPFHQNPSQDPDDLDNGVEANKPNPMGDRAVADSVLSAALGNQGDGSDDSDIDPESFQ